MSTESVDRIDLVVRLRNLAAIHEDLVHQNPNGTNIRDLFFAQWDVEQAFKDLLRYDTLEGLRAIGRNIVGNLFPFLTRHRDTAAATGGGAIMI